MAQLTQLIIVSGRVQGVGFRFFTHQQAKKLGLHGYVENLSNGQVKIVIQGDNQLCQQFLDWLAAGGPASASITTYDVKALPDASVWSDFRVKSSSSC